MAAVYKARDTRYETWCAIKEMSLSMAPANERSQALANFLAEARILSRLKHPNMPAFTDFFTEGERYFLVMEFVNGNTLEELLEANHGPFSEQRILGWARQLCDVLEYLHNQQPPVIFRDLKPGNIMLTEGGRIKLIDFGIARLFRRSGFQDTQLLGTPGFAPPEQYGSAQTDERSDIYSLAMTLAQLMTDAVNDNGFGLKDIHSTYPHISPPVAHVLEKATSLKPDDRYKSVLIFRQALLGIGTFRFENGDEAITPDELADICSRYSSEALDYLFSGEIEAWLQDSGQEEIAHSITNLRMAGDTGEEALNRLIQLLSGSPRHRTRNIRSPISPLPFSQASEEMTAYLESDTGWTDVREHLRATRAKSIVLIVSMQSSLRSLAGWKLIYADACSLDKEITVVSLDQQIRATARVAGLKVAASREDLQPDKALPLRRKPQPVPVRKETEHSPPRSALIRRPRRFPGRSQQTPSTITTRENKKIPQQSQSSESIELSDSIIDIFTDRDTSISRRKPVSTKIYTETPGVLPQKMQPSPVQEAKLSLIRPYQVFLCYAREDEKLLDQLRKHLKALQRQQYIEPWYDRNISAGSNWEKDIDEHLATADIILLLVSPDFMASDYCYGVEVERAMDRHNKGEAIVIPVILRHTHWKGALFGDLQALPEDAKPIYGPDYPYLDKGFLEVIEGILESIRHLEDKKVTEKDEKEASLSAKKTEQKEPHNRHIWEGEQKPPA